MPARGATGDARTHRKGRPSSGVLQTDGPVRSGIHARHSARMRSHVRVLGSVTLLAGLLAGMLGVTPVAAWNANEDDYSTHDWLVDQAVRILDGRVDWLDVRTAILSSDDPDADKSSVLNHSYRDNATRGSVPQETAEHFHRAFVLVGEAREAEANHDSATAAAKYHEASYEIGLMSHFITDVLQPFHASVLGLDDPHNYHHAYEMLVGVDGWKGKDAHPEWQPSSRSVSTISNSRAVAINAAAYSRSLFPSLMSHLEATGGRRLDDRANEITRAVLRRAAQDLANLIWSIDQQVGDAPMASVTLTVTHRYAGGRVAVETKATSPAGKAIEGLVIEVTAPKAGGGTLTRSRATGPDGTALNWFDAVGSLYRKQTITVKAVSLGVALVKTTWYMRTPSLGSFSVRMQDYTLAKGQTARAAAVAKDGAGRPVHDILVSFRWSDGATTKAYTNSDGKAVTTRVIAKAGSYTLRARAESGGHTYTRYKSFTQK
jgi:hypothetical protein